MSSILSKISSLKEDIEELQLAKDAKTYNVLCNISRILEEMAEEIDKTRNSVSEINEYVTVLDENLGNIEEEVYGFETEDEEFNNYDYIDIECDKCHEIIAIEKGFIKEEDSIKCPNCQNSITLKKE